MKFVNFAIVKFSLFLTLGIFLAKFFPVYSILSLYLLIPLILVLGIAWFFARKQLIQNIFFGLITFVCFFSLGYINYKLRLPEFQEVHYFQSENKSEQLNSQNKIIQLKIKEVLKSDTYNRKYIAKVIAINGKGSCGSILLNLKKDSLNTIYTIDDVLLIYSKTYDIPTPLNPHQFNYSEYMKTLGVYQQLRISKIDILQKVDGSSSLRGKAEKTRNYIIKKLKKSPLTSDELSIIQALILGQRKDISKQIYSDYAAAGAIHILAVSGLHVGIVYFILLFLFTPLKRFPYGKLIRSVLIVLCLWGFAFITGLSPSVIRSVTMFSFFAFATIINRQTNSINTLFLSYFVLLLVNPKWLFYVGFQLSYLAVFFILWILPLFNKMYNPKNYFIIKVWDIFMVTIAAQLGIIPLSLYYFHQFPGLFLVTNLIILPFLSILLGGGLLIIVLAVINLLPDWLAISYNFVIKTLNGFINWIANQDLFLFQDIHFSFEKVLGSYLLTISLIFLWKKKTYNRIIFSLMSIVMLICIFIWNEYKYSSNQLIVFHKKRHSLIGYKHSNKLQLFRDDSSFKYKNNYPIKGYRIAKNITFYTEENLFQILTFNHKKILVLDSLGIYPKTSKIAIVLLTFSPKVNLERLLDSLQPNLIIADGNNYNSFIDRWRKTCNLKNVAFYDTNKNGAYFFK